MFINRKTMSAATKWKVVGAGIALGSLAVFGLTQSQPNEADFRYVLVDLGDLGGGDSGALAVNNNKVVVGWSTTSQPIACS